MSLGVVLMVSQVKWKASPRKLAQVVLAKAGGAPRRGVRGTNYSISKLQTRQYASHDLWQSLCGNLNQFIFSNGNLINIVLFFISFSNYFRYSLATKIAVSKTMKRQ